MSLIEQCQNLANNLTESTRARNTAYKNLGAEYFNARVVEKTKYILIDEVRGGQPSGCYMVEKATGLIYAIKSAYGVINRNKCFGHIENMQEMEWLGGAQAWPKNQIKVQQVIGQDGQIGTLTTYGKKQVCEMK